MEGPLFSVGITTYRRHEPLKKAIQSVLDQSYPNIEIIVGNDFQGETLTLEMLGISDPRVHILNYPKNLREIGNMNALLASARGQYFTWMADDDYCSKYFFEALAKALKTAKDIGQESKAAFTSFGITQGYEDPIGSTLRSSFPCEMISAPRFVSEVLSNQRRAMGLCGVYDTEFARSVLKGIEPVVDSAVIGVYAEYLLLAKLAHISEIPYVDLPLTFYRVHEQAWSVMNKELELFREAGIKLVEKSLPWILRGGDNATQNSMIVALLKMAIDGYYGKHWLVHHRFAFFELSEYLSELRLACAQLGPSRVNAIFGQLSGFLLRLRFKMFVKTLLPDSWIRSAKKLVVKSCASQQGT